MAEYLKKQLVEAANVQIAMRQRNIVIFDTFILENKRIHIYKSKIYYYNYSKE